MASIVVTGDTSGAITIAAPAVAGTNTLTLPASTGTLVVTGGAQTIEFAAGTVSAPSITFTGDTNTGIFSPAADTIAFTEGGVESMRIDSSGNVGIGTSTITSGASWTPRLVLSGTSAAAVVRGINSQEVSVGSSNGMYIDCLGNTTGSNNNIIFRNTASNSTFSASERVRITSSGFLKASNTGTYYGSTGSYHEIVSNVSGDNPLYIISSSANPYGPYIGLTGASPNNASNYFLYCGDSSALRCVIYSNGNIANVTGSYGTISDAKLKENIVDATPKLDKVNQLKVRNFNLIGDELKQIGFVAQEFEEVFPSMVEESPIMKDGKPTDETSKTIKTSVLVPILVKAIQEQQQIINDLKARIETLEGAK